MALSTAIFELASSNITAAKLTDDDEDEIIDGSSEERGGNKIGLLVIFTGFALALFFTCFLLICCKFFARKPVTYSGPTGNEHRSTREHKKRVLIERQTTTSDEYNPDGYSYYYDDSTYSQGPTESETPKERKYEKKDKREEGIEMNVLRKSSDHHHKCPHYADVHKPQQPKVEPRREIAKDDLIDRQQLHSTGHMSAGICVHSTSGQAQLESMVTIEKEIKSEQNSSPSKGSKIIDSAIGNPPKSTSVRLFIKQDARKRNQRSMSTAQPPSSSLVSPSKSSPDAPKARSKSHSLSGESLSSPKPPSISCSSLERQESMDVPDDLEKKSRTTLNVIKGADSIESSGSDRSPETVRRQYKELWSLRASYAESEENKLLEEGADGGVGGNSGSGVEEGGASSIKKEQIKLEQLTGDSGYKSMEIVNINRKDYSIDMKTEEIYRQFTSNNSDSESTIKLASSGHPSIEETNEEEDEEDMVEIFF